MILKMSAEDRSNKILFELLVAGRYQRALELAREYRGSDPDSGFLDFVSGVALSEMRQDIDVAEAHLVAAVGALPDYLPAQIALARHHYLGKAYGKAKRICEAVLARDPEQPSAWSVLGWCLFLENDYVSGLSARPLCAAACPET